MQSSPFFAGAGIGLTAGFASGISGAGILNNHTLTINNSTVTGIGIQKAGKLFYNAMLSKTAGMTYLKYRTATNTMPIIQLGLVPVAVDVAVSVAVAVAVTVLVATEFGRGSTQKEGWALTPSDVDDVVIDLMYLPFDAAGLARRISSFTAW